MFRRRILLSIFAVVFLFINSLLFSDTNFDFDPDNDNGPILSIQRVNRSEIWFQPVYGDPTAANDNVRQYYFPGSGKLNISGEMLTSWHGYPDGSKPNYVSAEFVLTAIIIHKNDTLGDELQKKINDGNNNGGHIPASIITEQYLENVDNNVSNNFSVRTWRASELGASFSEPYAEFIEQIDLENVLAIYFLQSYITAGSYFVQYMGSKYSIPFDLKDLQEVAWYLGNDEWMDFDGSPSSSSGAPRYRIHYVYGSFMLLDETGPNISDFRIEPYSNSDNNVYYYHPQNTSRYYINPNEINSNGIKLISDLNDLRINTDRIQILKPQMFNNRYLQDEINFNPVQDITSFNRNFSRNLFPGDSVTRFTFKAFDGLNNQSTRGPLDIYSDIRPPMNFSDLFESENLMRIEPGPNPDSDVDIKWYLREIPYDPGLTVQTDNGAETFSGSGFNRIYRIRNGLSESQLVNEASDHLCKYNSIDKIRRETLYTYSFYVEDNVSNYAEDPNYMTLYMSNPVIIADGEAGIDITPRTKPESGFARTINDIDYELTMKLNIPNMDVNTSIEGLQIVISDPLRNSDTILKTFELTPSQLRGLPSTVNLEDGSKIAEYTVTLNNQDLNVQNYNLAHKRIKIEIITLHDIVIGQDDPDVTYVSTNSKKFSETYTYGNNSTIPIIIPNNRGTYNASLIKELPGENGIDSEFSEGIDINSTGYVSKNKLFVGKDQILWLAVEPEFIDMVKMEGYDIERDSMLFLFNERDNSTNSSVIVDFTLQTENIPSELVDSYSNRIFYSCPTSDFNDNGTKENGAYYLAAKETYYDIYLKRNVSFDGYAVEGLTIIYDGYIDPNIPRTVYRSNIDLPGTGSTLLDNIITNRRPKKFYGPSPSDSREAFLSIEGLSDKEYGSGIEKIIINIYRENSTSSLFNTELLDGQFSADIDSEINIENIQLDLGEGDGVRTIGITVYDYAGNRSTVDSFVTVDMTSPNWPVNGAYTDYFFEAGDNDFYNAVIHQRPENDEAYQEWKSIQGIKEYYLFDAEMTEWLNEPQTADEDASFTGETFSYAIDGNTVPPNSPLYLKQRAVDFAGNVSPEYEYEFYSLAEFPAGVGVGDYLKASASLTDQELGFVFEPGAEGHNATAYRIYRLDENGEVLYRVGEADLPVVPGSFQNDETPFQDYLLSGHDIASYRIHAVNADGKEGFASESIRVRMPNRAPYETEIDFDFSVDDNGIAVIGLNPGLSWSFPDGQTAWDPDGDKVLFYIVVDGIEVGPVVDNDGYSLTGIDYQSLREMFPSAGLPALADGESHTFALIIEDNFEYDEYLSADETEDLKRTVCGTQAVVIDGILPEIRFESMSRYSNDNEIGFTVIEESTGLLTGSVRVLRSGTGESYPVTVSEGEAGVYYCAAVLPDGVYSVNVECLDGAGNDGVAENLQILLDSVPPSITDDSTEFNLSTSPFASGSVSFETAVTDDLSGAQSLLCRWRDTETDLYLSDQYVYLDMPARFDGDSAQQTVVGSVSLNGVDGESYRLEIRAVDWAGNIGSAVEIPEDVVLDSSGPEITLDIESGTVYSQGQLYVSDVDSLSLSSPLSTEPHGSGVAEERLGLRDADSGAVVWSNSLDLSVLIALAGIENGRSYELGLWSENGAGASSEKWSGEVFTVDASAPTDCRIVSNTGDGRLVPGESFRVDVSAFDSDSGIDRLLLSVGTAADPTLISSRISGNENGSLVKHRTSSGSFTITIPETALSGEYEIVLTAVNGSGLSRSTAPSSFSIVLDGEKLSVYRPYEFLPETGVYPCAWSYFGTSEVSGYRYLVSAGSTPPVYNDSFAYTEDKALLHPLESPLVDGGVYTLHVWALGVEGTPIAYGNNGGITVDLTGPKLIIYTADPYTDGDSLGIGWEIDDAESGLSQLEVVLDVFTGEDPVTHESTFRRIRRIPLPAESLGNMKLNLKEEGFDLAHGDRLYATIRAYNGAGTVREFSSGVIMVDVTAPHRPLVMDQGAALNPQKQDFRFQWQWSLGDPESGVSYQWNWFVNDGKPGYGNWESIEGTELVVDPDTFGTLNHGDRVFLALKAVNGTGAETIGYSDGITVDLTAPYLTDVRILNTQGEGELYVSSRKNLVLAASGGDDYSEIEILEYSQGVLDRETGSLSFFPETSTLDAGSSGSWWSTGVNLSDDVDSGEVVVFRARLKSNGDYSGYGYSTGVLYEDLRPEVTDLCGYYSDEQLYFDWKSGWVDGKAGRSPITEYHYRLYLNDALVETGSTTGTSCVLDATSYGQGRYRIQVQAVTATGQTGAFSAMSPVVMVDLSPADIADFWTNRFTAEKVLFRCNAVEDLSSITDYEYSVGTLSDMFAVSGGWLGRTTSASYIEDRIEFADAPCGPEGLVHGTELFVQMRVRNSAGYWSDYEIAGPVEVDRTLANVLVGIDKTIDWDGYLHNTESGIIGSDQILRGITVSAEDPESGVLSYRMAVSQKADASDSELSGLWSAPVIVANDSEPVLSSFDLADGTLTLGNIADGGRYYLYVEVLNGAYEYSEAGISDELYADFTAPRLVFDLSELPLVKLHDDSTIEVIVNETPQSVPFTVDDNLDGEVLIRFNIYHDGETVSSEYRVFDLAEGYSGQFVFDPDVYMEKGRYDLEADLLDMGENLRLCDGEDPEETANVWIRINSPPFVDVMRFDTTPGKPLHGDGSEIASDPDEDEIIYYRWLIDGEEISATALFDGTFFHRQMWDQRSEYDIVLEAVDEFGLKGTGSNLLIVENTRAGQLYFNEYWAGEHNIRGDITVGEEWTLETAPGTEITVEGDIVIGYDHRLVIDGTFIADGTTFDLDAPEEIYWRGIIINGTAEMTDTTIRRALQGLALSPAAQVDLDRLVFESNWIGLHIVSLAPDIKGFEFRNNDYVGLKEDQGAAPRVRDCLFAGNRYDYYDEELTMMSYDEINETAGNSGNWGE